MIDRVRRWANPSVGHASPISWGWVLAVGEGLIDWVAIWDQEDNLSRIASWWPNSAGFPSGTAER